ncbi:uncharacterized protein LOC141664592 [Apium graveolens]|uniref:uncharacterized protein LOC141664592 n=1 Tax=Apium graveolens TaxID=4045 RepID=UPI003D7B2104
MRNKRFGGGWHISGTPLDLHDPRILAITEAERQMLEAEYDEYTSTNASGASFLRSAALILMALLLLRHAVTVTDVDEDGDASNFFTEAAALAATHFAFILQSRTPRGLHITLASAPTATTQQ